MTTDKEKELESLINSSIPFTEKDCHVMKERKKWQRSKLKEKIIIFISGLK